MTRRDRPGRQGEDALGGGRPVERIAIAEPRRRAVLQQVAGEQDSGVRHHYHDVRVGVAATQEPQVDRPSADIDGGRIREGQARWRDDDLAPLVGTIRIVLEDLGPFGLAEFEHPGHASLVAPQLDLGEHRVAERVIPVPMGVHRPADDRTEQPELGAELGRVTMGRAGVDHEEPVGAANDADRLVDEPVTTDPHAVADLMPDGARRHVRDGTARAATLAAEGVTP